MILLTPGPCQTSNSVRQAGAEADLNHREPEFLELVRDTKDRLLRVYPGMTEWVPYLIGGSGTAAMEAMVTSCAPRSGMSLVLTNGYYSERMSELFAVHQFPFRELNFDWSAPWDLSQVRESMQGVQAVFATHHETTTGRLNDLAGLAALCNSQGTHLFVDAMSSFGADPIELTHLSGLCASANKCLHGVPGVGFVLLHPQEAIRIREASPITYYLHLPRYEGDQPPLTPPVPALRSMRQALSEMPLEGAKGRQSSYLAKGRIIESALKAVGLPPILDAADRSCALLMSPLPGCSYAEWFSLTAEKGFIIYGCKGPFSATHFQVSPMGEVSEADVSRWAYWLTEIVSEGRLRV